MRRLTFRNCYTCNNIAEPKGIYSRAERIIQMKPDILCKLADNYLFNELLNGNKPCCAIYSKELAMFATQLDLEVKWVSGNAPYYIISTKRPIKEYFQLKDILGIVNTKRGKCLYNKIKDMSPARAFKHLSQEIQKHGETMEMALINGLLCGYSLCDIVEYLETQIMKSRKFLPSKKYNKKMESDYKIQSILCAYCRKQYLKNGI